MEKSENPKGPENPVKGSESTHEIFMQWVTTAYRLTEKSKAWYVIMGGIVLAFILYDLATGGWIVSIAFLILAGVYYWNENQRVPIVQVAISDHGIRYGRDFYAYSQIKSFWILDEPDMKALNLTFYKGTHRNVSILIPEDLNIARLREYLTLQIVEEEGKKESFSDQLIRNLGL